MEKLLKCLKPVLTAKPCCCIGVKVWNVSITIFRNVALLFLVYFTLKMASDGQKFDLIGSLHGRMNITLKEIFDVKFNMLNKEKGTTSTKYDQVDAGAKILIEEDNFLNGTLNITLPTISNGEFNGTLVGEFKDVMRGKLEGELSGNVSGTWNRTMTGTFKGKFIGEEKGTLHGTLNGSLFVSPDGKLISVLDGNSLRVSLRKRERENDEKLEKVVERVNGTYTDKFNGTVHITLNGTWANIPNQEFTPSMLLGDMAITLYILCVVASVVGSFWFIKSILANDPTQMSYYITINGVHIVFSCLNAVVFSWYFLLVALVDIYFYLCAKALQRIFADTIQADNAHPIDKTISSPISESRPASYNGLSPEGVKWN